MACVQTNPFAPRKVPGCEISDRPCEMKLRDSVHAQAPAADEGAGAPSDADGSTRGAFFLRPASADTSRTSTPGATRRSSLQGRHAGIKEYAAQHILEEETARKAKALSEVLQSGDGSAASETRQAKAMRDFSEATRLKVLRAAEQHMEAKYKVDVGTAAQDPSRKSKGTDSDSKSNSSSAGDHQLDTVDDMMQQKRKLLSAGFDAEAEKLQTRLEAVRQHKEKERHEEEQRIMKQRLSALDKEHKERRERLGRTQAEELAEAEDIWRDEIASLMASQANETHEFELRITRAAALEVGNALNPYPTRLVSSASAVP